MACLRPEVENNLLVLNILLVIVLLVRIFGPPPEPFYCYYFDHFKIMLEDKLPEKVISYLIFFSHKSICRTLNPLDLKEFLKI